MVEYSASLRHWAGKTLQDIGEFTLAHLSHPSTVCTLAANMLLAPISDTSAIQMNIIDPLLNAYANQLSKLYDDAYSMSLLRKIEFAKGTNLERIWGDVYRVKRLALESDDNYRKRLEVYIKTLVGSGTKAACEEIIDIIVDRRGATRIDPSWPAHCRIYIKDCNARIKARERVALIDRIAPQMLAAGITYRLYIPYRDLAASVVLNGPDYISLSSDIALQAKRTCDLYASIFMAKRELIELDATLRLAKTSQKPLKAQTLLQDEVRESIGATEALSGSVAAELDGNMALMGIETLTLKATQRRQSTALNNLHADTKIQGRHLRPVMARMLLEEA
jgi:hypothetical protein